MSPTALDPVCGMSVDPRMARGGALVHEGVEYAFCSEHCRAEFEREPPKYVGMKASAGDAGGEGGEADRGRGRETGRGRGTGRDAEGLYVCPMHPEVEQIGPGTCPICGMALEPKVASVEEPENEELLAMTRRLWASVALAVPALVLAMADMVPGLRGTIPPGPAAWIQLALSTPVVLWGGAPFFARGWASLRNRRANMFTLIALGTGAAYLFSLFGLLSPGPVAHSLRHGGAPPVYFESAAAIVSLVLLGQVLELRARAATSGAIRALLGLSPETARRVAGDGGERDVALADVQEGDRLRVR